MTTQLYDDGLGTGYGELRRPDPRLRAAIHRALAPARTILNVGAGTGSYEPESPGLVAVEPSATMIRQRRRPGPVVRASGVELPFAADSFDASLAILTVHHWPDAVRGLKEMRRVARQRVTVFTWDPDASGFWLTERYFPEILQIDRRIFPTRAEFEEALGPIRVSPVEIPHDCTDGFLGAYWRRPFSYLDAEVRAAISTFSKISGVEDGLARLARDLETGVWQEHFGRLRFRESLDLGYRLVVADL